mmetsp:Transcript_79797/g.237701  ORF Transcript_79797/g.237701 Transcript_79797/m.237701 type:complete len:277 (+) Transcript_79797:469-1299(+)
MADVPVLLFCFPLRPSLAPVAVDLRELAVVRGLLKLVLPPLLALDMLAVGPHLAGRDRLLVELRVQVSLGLLAVVLLLDLLLQPLPLLLLRHPLPHAGVGVSLALELLKARDAKVWIVDVDGAVLLQGVGVAQVVLAALLLLEVGERKVVRRLVAIAHGCLLHALQVVKDFVLQQLRLRVLHLLLHLRHLPLPLLCQLRVQHLVVHPQLPLARVEELRAALHLLLPLPHDLLRQIPVVCEVPEVRMPGVRRLEARPRGAGDGDEVRCIVGRAGGAA